MEELLRALQLYVNEPQHRALIEQVCDECEAELQASPGLGMTYRVAIRGLAMAGTAGELRSLWVFAFAPRGASDLHKHSNSMQVTCAWRGQGRVLIGDPARPVTVCLSQSIGNHQAAQNWAVIPPGTFHQAVAG